MLFVALAGAVFISGAFRNTIADTDIWWHLRNAEYLLHTGSLPRYDMFSFTVAGKPWMNNEWLSELPFWFAWQWMGVRGLFLITVVLMQTIMAGVLYLGWLRTGDIKGSFLACVLALLMAMVSYGPRTLLFGWLLFVFELILLHKFHNGTDHLWLLPPLFCVWINAHGSWMIGMVYLLIFIACGFAKGTWGWIESARWSPRQARKLTAVSASSLLALLVNPFGWRLVAFPFDMAFIEKVNTVVNQEWQNINFHDLRGRLVFLAIVLFGVTSLARKRHWVLYDLVFLLLAIYSSMAYLRFVFLLGIILCPMLARELALFPPYAKERDKPLLNAVAMAGLLLFCILRFPSEAKLQNDVAQGSEGLPSQALPFLHTFYPQGRVLSDVNWGGYLIWNAPQILVFADTRGDIFDHYGVLADYMSIINIRSPLEILNKYGIRYVFFPNDAPLTYLLRITPGWKVDYENGDAVLFERIESKGNSSCP
jgi:hypothetical protein